MYGWFAREEQYRDKAQEFSFKALMYDNTLPEAYTAMGLSYLIWGKFDEAAGLGEQGHRTRSGRLHRLLDARARPVLDRQGRGSGGQFQARHARSGRRFYTGFSDLCQTLEGLGRHEEARAAAERIVEMMPTYLLQNPDDARGRMIYAHMLCSVGRSEQGKVEAQAAIDAAPGDSVMAYNAACLYAKLGEKRRALDTLRLAIDAGVKNFQWMRHDPDLNSLRDDPEFIAMTEDK